LATIALVISTVVLALISIAIQFVIPAFGEVFGSFGADLPKLTLLVQAHHRAALFLPALPILTYAFWPNRVSKVRVALIVCWLSVLPIVVMIVAMYLPIFKLGAVV
jgi:type II secretory pathway component PulF